MKTLPLLALALGLATSAHAQGVSDTEIKIGGSTALTGPGALVGIAHDLGEKIATAEINAAGGINGRKIVRVFEDDAYVPARTVTTVRKLLDVDHVLAITASSGTASTLAALPMMEEQGVPALQTAAPNPVMFSPMHKTLFVVGRAYGPGTTDFVKFLAARKPGAKFLAIVQDDDYGDDVQSGYEKAVADLKLTSVGVLRYKRGQKDFAAEVLKAKQLGATIVVSGGIIAENVTIAKEARRVGLEAEIAMLWSGRLPQTIDLMGEAGNGIIAADYVGDFDEGAGKALFDKARTYLNPDERAKLNRYSLTGYVGARLLFDAIARCGRDVTRACVTAKLETTTNLDMNGLTSPISFTPTSRISDLKLRYTILDWSKKAWVPIAGQ